MMKGSSLHNLSCAEEPDFELTIDQLTSIYNVKLCISIANNYKGDRSGGPLGILNDWFNISIYLIIFSYRRE